MGVTSFGLIGWDIYNQAVIRSMGMAWDTGAPLWPYQTPDTINTALSAPAYLLANPLANLLGLQMPHRYFVVFPAIVLWWWFVGWYLDRRTTKSAEHRTNLLSILLCLLAIALLSAGAYQFWIAIEWWATYSRSLLSSTNIILLRLLTPAAWTAIFGTVALFAAVRHSPILNNV